MISSFYVVMEIQFHLLKAEDVLFADINFLVHGSWSSEVLTLFDESQRI